LVDHEHVRDLHQARLHRLRSEEHTSELQSPDHFVCRLLLEKKNFVGYPRFPAPVEFIAAVISYYVHPVNIQTACLIMEGAEFTENIIYGVERPVKAAELFAFSLRVRAGNTGVLHSFPTRRSSDLLLITNTSAISIRPAFIA